MRYTTLKYAVAGRIARITLNRPARLNAIDDKMPREIRRAVEAASAASSVHPSAMPSTGCPGDSESRWSHTHAESRPTASA